MNTFRKIALSAAYSKKPVEFNEKIKPSEIFAENVFTLEKMREYLSNDVYKKLNQPVKDNLSVDRKTAEQVALAMKSWATQKYATHYTHWFQPLTGATAEKHDAFLAPVGEGKAIEIFDGSSLIQQESDASSLPSGGMRNTFEARGYTAWDPSSPAFLMDDTLCIPTIFISYTGEALDFKTPLLKALSLIDKAAVEVCRLFDKNITKVTASLGIEQEYFLVDEDLFNARPDLFLAGRTLFGHETPKGQQLEDNYFGVIPKRVMEYMKELEYHAWKLGIPLKTRHNEVAPNQYELAPVYEEANLANDHNQLVMILMNKIAQKHGFRVLFHEKPYAGVNGSGKHNNWSLITNTGENLFSSGKTPDTNLLFLTFFINTLKAVEDYPDLIRATIASAGNDLRLGANEAPPAIMSVFIGSQLTQILNDIESMVKKGKMTQQEKNKLKINISKIPQIILDNTDRNRTSPFAFTGNKFEFRAVGSSDNCGAPMIVLNVILANQLKKFKNEVDMLLKEGIEKEEAILRVLRNAIKCSKRILFEGNSYGEEWKQEAIKRGLKNITNTPDALGMFLEEKSVKLFENNEIFTRKELIARYHIKMDKYYKKIQIESRVLGDIALTHIIPTAIKYQSALIENTQRMKQIFNENDYNTMSATLINMIKEMSEKINNVKSLVLKMTEERKKTNNIEDASDKAKAYCKNVLPYLNQIRYNVDKLELMIDDEIWPLPKYRELLFVK